VDHGAHQHAEDGGDRHGEHDRQHRVEPVMDGDGQKDADEGDDRADRQVDATADHDEGHADGRHTQKGIVSQ